MNKIEDKEEVTTLKNAMQYQFEILFKFASLLDTLEFCPNETGLPIMRFSINIKLENENQFQPKCQPIQRSCKL